MNFHVLAVFWYIFLDKIPPGFEMTLSLWFGNEVAWTALEYSIQSLLTDSIGHMYDGFLAEDTVIIGMTSPNFSQNKDG